MFVAFDIETDGLFDGTTPPNITCCATRLVKGDSDFIPRVFHSQYAPAMLPRDICDMVEYLYALHVSGVHVVTFNGAGFDFKVVFEHLKDHPRQAAYTTILAREHIDLMFEFACRNGYYASMNSFCEGSRLAVKNGSGADAIGMWVGPSATLASQAAVLAYCANDVRCLADLYEHVVKHGGATRLTKRGAAREVQFASPPMPVSAAATLFKNSPPENDWMTDPPDILGAVTWCGV